MRTQQELIRNRRGEAVTLKQEAACCKAEADSYAILGTCERELGNRSTALLEQAELKQREANRRSVNGQWEAARRRSKRKAVTLKAEALAER